jgi:hypothetical protein
MLARLCGGTWKAVRDGFSWAYKCDDGRRADWRAHVGGFCGDDYVGSGLYVYAPGKAPEQVYFRPA